MFVKFSCFDDVFNGLALISGISLRVITFGRATFRDWQTMDKKISNELGSPSVEKQLINNGQRSRKLRRVGGDRERNFNGLCTQLLDNDVRLFKRSVNTESTSVLHFEGIIMAAYV